MHAKKGSKLCQQFFPPNQAFPQIANHGHSQRAQVTARCSRYPHPHTQIKGTSIYHDIHSHSSKGLASTDIHTYFKGTGILCDIHTHFKGTGIHCDIHTHSSKGLVSSVTSIRALNGLASTVTSTHYKGTGIHCDIHTF